MPVDVRRVRDPRGEVDWEEVVERSVDLVLVIEEVWDIVGVMDFELAIDGV